MSEAHPLPFPTEVWAGIVAKLKLAPQQTRIVELILRGMKDKQIASELEISVPTVRTYLGRVFVRLGVRDRVELILNIVARVHAPGDRRS
ncbi:MAG: helix-turn-helix transcriptional regulator [Phycisphaerales bacterium]